MLPKVNISDDKRFGVIVLPYEMRGIALAQEIMLDYVTGHMYVRSMDGTYDISITKELETRIENIINQVNDSESIIVDIEGIGGDTLNPALNELKRYTDALVQGVSVKKSVDVVENFINLALAGIPTEPIDGIIVEEGNTVLLNAQTNGAENGKWEIKASEWTRCDDMNETQDVNKGAFVFVQEGDRYGDSGWVLTTDGEIIIGTTPLKFQRFSGAGQIIAGIGITKDGNELSLTPTGVTAGTYTKFTTDIYGRVINAFNPTTLAGYNITDAAPIVHVGSKGSAHGNADSAQSGFMSADSYTLLHGLPNVIDDAVVSLEVEMDTKITGEAVQMPNVNVPSATVVVEDNVTSNNGNHAFSARQGTDLNNRVNNIGRNQNASNPYDIRQWVGSMVEYDALESYDPNTFYYIIG